YGNWEVLWNRASDISHYFDIDLTQAFKFSYELFLLDKFKQDFNNSYGVLFEDMKKLKSLEIQKIIAEFSWICKVINARNSKEFLVNINRLDKNLQKIQNQDKRNFVKKNIFKKPPENSRRMLRYYLDDTMLSWEYFMIMNAEPGDASYYLDISIDTVNIIRKAAKEGARNGKSASDIDETIRYFLQLHRKQANPEVKKPVGNLETEAINSSI
ncbi:MAG: hypothetical protein KAR20_09905, partial [Candidatus Heimdallarchaeota archaeon]|nr:hypothetical protein [Candidatus Heimdallarchaeota archaeon]